VSFSRRLGVAALSPTDCLYSRPNALSSHPCAFGSIPKFPTLHARDSHARPAPDYARSRTSTMCWQIMTTHFEHASAPCGSALQVPMSILRLCVAGRKSGFFVSYTICPFYLRGRQSLDSGFLSWVGFRAQRKLALGTAKVVPMKAVKLQEVTCPVSKLFAKSFEISWTWQDMQWRSACSKSPRSSPDAVSSHARIYLNCNFTCHSFCILVY
jgi:hypothetical protein